MNLNCMKHFITFIFLLVTTFSFAQDDELVKSKDSKKSNDEIIPVVSPKAKHEQYRIISLQRDTTYVDTTLTIKKEYEYNYLRKDIFGLLPFANEGQTYTVLDFGLKHFSPFPEIGISGKHFNYLEVNDIKYYSVATPLTELYFKTVMEQGQSIDAFVTVNTSERFNISLAYKGLRSLGKYVNQLSSTGNFRFTTSYTTINKRYNLNFHFTSQDFLNGENGGITTIEDFENENAEFKNRARFEVYLTDATSFLKGKRFFLDHNFRINSNKTENNLFITHQFNYETKFFEFNQKTILSTVGDTKVKRFGDSYVSSNINDQTNYNRMYNKFGALYENRLLGKFQLFTEDFRFNYFFDKILILETGIVPNLISDQINTIGGQYEYKRNKWKAIFLYSNTLSNQSLSNFDAKLVYNFNDKNEFFFQYQNTNKLPNHNYNLNQSSYVSYNWYNDFKNVKINNIEVVAKTQWFNAAIQLSSLNDYLYFSNDDVSEKQLISPKQYNETINYLSVKISKEFKFRKFALDNTVLYQEVNQSDAILNVPQIVTRNTLYYTNYFFKKALFLQTGVTFNYFTKYYANDYNPVIGESFVQNQKEIGAFPMLDFFINARIRQTRIFLKAEHFNSGFTGNTFYNGPNYPYRDFIIRFGLVWNFFQ